MKKSKIKMFLVYVALFSISCLLFFPIYWVLASSFKTREAMNTIPPTFYPTKYKTKSLSILFTDNIYKYNNSFYIKLANLNNQISFYYKLDDNFNPTNFVDIIPNKLTQKINFNKQINFYNLPVHYLLNSQKEVIVLAKTIYFDNNKNSEILFVPKLNKNKFNGIEVYKNAQHKPATEFYARLENYTETLQGPDAATGLKDPGFLTYLKNSFLISILAVLGQVLTASFAAYGFSRINFKGREVLFVLLLATLMVPAQVTLIPLFTIYKSFGWINTFLPLIVPHFTAGAFNVFLIRQYMLTLPKELDESALIDGCSRLKIFYKIILPNSIPVLIVVGIFTFVATWQDMLGPLMYLDDPELRTVQLGLEYFRSPYIDNRHLLLAGAVISMVPIAVLFIFLQRYIMTGIATTGMKN